MKNSRSEKKKNKFIASIIESLGMNINEFQNNLSNGENFEITIYQWSISLLEEGKTTNETIKIIEERIIKVTQSFTQSFHSDKDIQIAIKKYNKIIAELETRIIYNRLENFEKKDLQKKIVAFVETRLYNYLEIVDFAINIIDKSFQETEMKANDTMNTKKNLNNNKSNIISGIKNYLNHQKANHLRFNCNAIIITN